MLSIASSDPAWLHASFGVIALSHGFTTGVAGGLSAECLFNRGEALQIIKRRINGSTTAVTDATIGTIASLTNIEVSNVLPIPTGQYSQLTALAIVKMMTGSVLTSTTHMKGLQYLLSLRGQRGLSDIPQQASFLRRLVAW